MRMVSVPLNQNEFDALCSISYNIGSSALRNSSIIKRLNKEDREGAAKAFALWNKFNRKPAKGLTARRSREAALFLEPEDGHPEKVMPQQPEPSQDPLTPNQIMVAGVTGGGGFITVAHQTLSDPSTAVGKVSAYKNLASEIVPLFSWMPHHWLAYGAFGVGLFGAIHYGLPWLVRRINA